ncbi:MAG: DUF3301 domain-containing protein [Gammaproteobacteria bacterium]|nr:DUF3301 domain-containing protein [Gammaproteobacteria bacterium]
MYLTEVFVIFCASGVLYYWLQTMRIKELARLAGKRACAEADVLFLDDTVEQIRIGLDRDGYGRLKISRTYKFEYSLDGDSRHSGVLTMLGRRVVELIL